MVDGIFFLRFSAREELVSFSPIRMTYNIEKKGILLALTTKKPKRREKQVMHISLRIS
jgi:hypothetical protein